MECKICNNRIKLSFFSSCCNSKDKFKKKNKVCSLKCLHQLRCNNCSEFVYFAS